MPISGGGGPPTFAGNANGGRELGRISGPLLSEDLRRNGVNLAFDNDKLYLNVVNKYVGFGTNTPTRTLTAPGTSRFARTNSALSDLIVTTQADIGNLTFNDTDKIQNFTNNNITISPAAGDQLITFNGLGSTGYFAFLNNSLTGTTNTEINISPTGKTIVNSSAYINGSLRSTGNITFGGSITLGNDDTDSITFAADVNSDLIPQILTGTITGISEQLITENLDLLLTEDDQNLFTEPVFTPYLYSLGTSTKKWNNVYSQNLTVTDLFSTTATAGTWTQGGLTITGNSISAGTGTTNITISGTGKVNLHNKIYIKDNTVTHNNAIVPLEMGATGAGYVKFGGTRGTVIPKGTTLERPAAAEIGTIRYNSNLNYIEVYANVSNTQVVSLSTNSVTATAGTWTQVHTLNNPNAPGVAPPLGQSPTLNDYFSRSVAVSGNYAIVSAPWSQFWQTPPNTDPVKVYIYNVTTGAIVHALSNPSGSQLGIGDEFGNSVAINGNYAIVGAVRFGNNLGKAYIYNVTTGALLYTLNNPTAYSTGASDLFGYSVAVSGNYAIVGAPQEDDAAGTDSGKAYIFNVTTGALVHTLNNPTAYSTSAGDLFGLSVAISGNYAVVGALGEDDAAGADSGKAYIFNVTTGALVHTLNNPTAYSTSASDLFGSSVAISGNYAVVGAPGEADAGGAGSGKAYIYTPNIILTTNTVGFNVGDFISSTSDLFAFATGTIITAVTTNTSITVSTPLLNILPAGSNLTSQRKWIPIIGTSPVLSVEDVNDIQDIWALILG